ncbi:MAG: amidohydrolase, partial [Verrucomicrobiota bacterium]
MPPHVLLAMALLVANITRAAEAGAATIYRNGTIVTLDAGNRLAEAMVVRGEEIAFVGSAAEALKAAGTNPTVVDLRGRTLLPGFYAAHDHFMNGSTAAMYQVDLNSPPIGSIETMDELIATLRTRAAATPPGQWVLGRGYDDTLLKEKRHPTRHDLDKMSTVHPIWITHTSGHLGSANSRALAIAKITSNTKNPASGIIQREPGTNVPNGVFEECGSLVSRHARARTREARIEAMRPANGRYLGRGVTTTVVAGGGREGLRDMADAMKRGFVDLRVISMISNNSVPATREETATWGGPPERARAGAVKILQDGSLQGYTGYLSQPYHVQPEGKKDYRGYALRSREALVKMVTNLHRQGYQVAIHGNGDAAIDDILFAFAEAQRAFPREDTRHRIEHCQAPREDQLKRMRELGITPSFFVGHVFYWGDRHRDIFLGPERGARISPLRSAREHGLHFTLHNDTPVTPADPLLLVWAAVTRETRDGKVLGPEQRISVIEALRAVTSDAAWQNFEEKRKGSIEAGKLADFVILAENPLTVLPKKLKDIAITETV